MKMGCLFWSGRIALFANIGIKCKKVLTNGVSIGTLKKAL